MSEAFVILSAAKNPGSLTLAERDPFAALRVTALRTAIWNPSPCLSSDELSTVQSLSLSRESGECARSVLLTHEATRWAAESGRTLLLAIVPALILAYLARERPRQATVSSVLAFRALHVMRGQRFGGARASPGPSSSNCWRSA